MALSIYNLISNELQSLGFFTELLESFDWDESNTKQFCQDVRDCFASEKMQNLHVISEAIPVFDSIMLEHGYKQYQIDIVKKMMNSQAKELIEISKLEYN